MVYLISFLALVKPFSYISVTLIEIKFRARKTIEAMFNLGHAESFREEDNKSSSLEVYLEFIKFGTISVCIEGIFLSFRFFYNQDVIFCLKYLLKTRIF